MTKKNKNENWDDYRYFLAVARAGTLSAAAERLGTEHTTVARHIHSLEEDLKNRLFHKSNTGYELTPAGERILAAVEAMESVLMAYKSNESDANDIAGVVRIGAPDGFGSVFLAPLMNQLTERYPQLEVEIFAAARVFSLSKREADIAIGLAGAEHMRVASRRLTDYRLQIYASQDYLDRAQPIRHKRDFANHPFVGYVEELLFAPELNFVDGAAVEIVSRLRSTNLLTQVHAVLGGHMLGILPAYIAASFPGLVPVLNDEVFFNRSFYMHVHEDHRKAAHVREVAKFIAEQVDIHRDLFISG
ncbi:LysR family transcriptional regulator [Pseudomonas syringae]|uniref:LysR family transcriptional regulator n=1 Tax=Pseudomonas syringae pv. aceris TaxID=199198 RepID=A0A0L8IQ03_PSESX|nr:LysR family transcriptional regulator [Pseudomonas syringae]EGH71526.1 LysR family transcriptional regulator [Pseudomonas syringae pv. aceris str. M302273]KOG03503.1 LysR family transcriptional regulator [Pseudomonas syringae pv. aceris]KPW09175.1 LysR family transcriptional regulator [Pseudomonas syringae pv. aceris]